MLQPVLPADTSVYADTDEVNKPCPVCLLEKNTICEDPAQYIIARGRSINSRGLCALRRTVLRLHFVTRNVVFSC